MTMTSLGSIVVIPDFDSAVGGAGTNFTYDQLTDSLSVIFQIPATGVITNVHYRVTAVTSPVMTHRIELRTVDNTTGKPNAAGNLYGSSTSITKDASTYTASTNMTATVSATGTAGDICALVFDLSAFTSGSFTQVQRYGGAVVGGLSNYPYQMSNTASADALAVLAVNAFAIEYGTDTYYPLGFDAVVSSVSTAPTSSSGGGATRRGNRYRPAVPQRAVGIKIFGDLDGDCFLRLRLQSDDSLLATATVDASNRGTANINWQQYKFDSGTTVNLTAGVDYYILLEANSGTTDSVALISNVPENAQLGQLSGGATCYGTSYSGSYTDVNTSRYGIGLMIDGFDNAAGGAGMLYIPNLSGT